MTAVPAQPPAVPDGTCRHITPTAIRAATMPAEPVTIQLVCGKPLPCPDHEPLDDAQAERLLRMVQEAADVRAEARRECAAELRALPRERWSFGAVVIDAHDADALADSWEQR